MIRRGGLLAAALVAACAHGASGGQGAEVPGDCAINLSGTWQQEGNVGLRYDASDDGQVLRLVPHRVNADGSPVAQDANVGGIAMELRREPHQVTGEFRMPVETDPDQSCPLLFQVKLNACAPDRLVLEIDRIYAVNPACAPIDLGPIGRGEQMLVRVK